MKTNKKYYWLKLKEDFFTQPRIKKLRRIAGGDTYTLIYLKLQLLSLKNAGALLFEGIEDTFIEELALTIDEDVENVKMTVMYLVEHGLMEEVNPDEFVLPETIKNIGSETASTIRSRKSREKKKLLQCNTNATICNTEIDIDIEKRDREKKEDKEQEREQEANLFDVFEHEFARPLSQIELQSIYELRNKYDDDLILYSLKLSIKNGVRKLAYIESILNNWNAQGIRTVSEAEEESSRFKNRKNNVRERNLPDWYLNKDENENQKEEQISPEEMKEFEELRARLKEKYKKE